ncbi:type VI secretion system protein TssA [Paraburkholderia phosphatilytica]|uniref:type VI secretion system protein TssA n=1 Tax=Paraburkholderia phosphatilytica TaxID=2282883 RepID=UPI000E4B82FC|nr:type VI secretion system protein TssA [Paraburkholderia phosphatilytica]
MSIDTNALLNPISETSPCGDDLLFSTDFDAIQHARRFDDPSLDQGEWVTEIKEADWAFVVERATALLQTQTKDLRLAVWLTEALTIEDGVAGLTAGYTLLTGLCARYWDTVHPLPESEDVEYRLGNVSWLAGRSAELLRAIPLTQAPDGAWRTLDWDVATHVAQAAKRDPEHANDIVRGKPSIEQIEASRRATPIAFYSALLAQLHAFHAALLALERELDLHAGDAAPSFRQTKDAYDAVYRLAERFAKEAGVTANPANAAPQASADTHEPVAVERVEPSFRTQSFAEDTAVPNPVTLPVAQAGLATRAQALAQLRAVAAYFRRTEPHSPVAYLADKAAEWADMPLHEWLASVVKDDGSLAHIRELLGVKPDSGS